NNIGVLSVNFRHSRLLAPAGVNHVLVTVIKQHRALGKRCFDLVLREVADGLWTGLERFGTSHREFLVLLRTRCAADTHSADDLPADADRNSALEWSKALESHHGRPAFVYDVFENLGRLLKEE